MICLPAQKTYTCTMKKLLVLLSTALVGVAVAITYHFFENAVHGSIDVVWYDWLNTDNHRWLVIPTCLILALTFFGLQHWLDRKSEKKEEKGLGEAPEFSLHNYLKILLIGYFSLLAGASLGPEAVLVPACVVIGGYIGMKAFGKDSAASKLLAAAGIMALFTAFFHSVIIGLLSILLVTKQTKAKTDAILVITAVISTVSAFLTLNWLEGESYATLPAYSWKINLETAVLSVLLVLGGYLAIMAMDKLHNLFESIRTRVNKDWYVWALAAGIGLSVLYLLGGPLVEFTGNKSIVPMFDQAADLGLIGLLWVLVVKLAAIGWSKALGYRGGMIFPTIFVAAVLVAIIQLYVPSFNLIYGLIATLVGAFAANKKTGILA